MSKVSEKASERVMSFVSEASVLVRRSAEPRPVGDKVKAAIGRAAKRLGLNYSRTKDLWYADRRISVDEEDVAQLRKRADQLIVEHAANNLLALHSRLSQTDPEFHGPTLLHLERALRGMGIDVGAVADREE